MVVEAPAEIQFEFPYLPLYPDLSSLATNLSPYHLCFSLKCSMLAWRLITIGLMPCLGFPIPHWSGQPFSWWFQLDPSLIGERFLYQVSFYMGDCLRTNGAVDIFC